MVMMTVMMIFLLILLLLLIFVSPITSPVLQFFLLLVQLFHIFLLLLLPLLLHLLLLQFSSRFSPSLSHLAPSPISSLSFSPITSCVAVFFLAFLPAVTSSLPYIFLFTFSPVLLSFLSFIPLVAFLLIILLFAVTQFFHDLFLPFLSLSAIFLVHCSSESASSVTPSPSFSYPFPRKSFHLSLSFFLFLFSPIPLLTVINDGYFSSHFCSLCLSFICILIFPLTSIHSRHSCGFLHSFLLNKSTFFSFFPLQENILWFYKVSL